MRPRVQTLIPPKKKKRDSRRKGSEYSQAGNANTYLSVANQVCIK
jgi:hypothetical protein